MLDVELPADLMVEPETPNRKKKKPAGTTPASSGGGTDEGEPLRRLTVQELHARHADSSDDSDEEEFDGQPIGDLATEVA